MEAGTGETLPLPCRGPAVVAVAVVVILLGHSIRVRLECGTRGFVLGLMAGALVAVDVRHHRKRAAA